MFIHSMPACLRELAAHHLEHYREAAGREAVDDPEWCSAMMRAFAGSDFIARSCIGEPALMHGLIASGELQRSRTRGEITSCLQRALDEVRDEDDLKRRLRLFRRREMLRIAWRDLLRWAPLDETLEDLSALADACIGAALAFLEQRMRRRYGTPRRADGRPQGLVVLGMGKLGARELNFSSDIDLIFAYAEEGQTRKRNGLSHEEFFLRLGRQLIDALNDTTDDGFVFRVDVRLRPYGDSGALALGFDAMESYYQYQGREWERYAMIKARVVAGDLEAGRELMSILRPFVYRRYLDFGVFESLREMHAMIRREVRRKGMADDIKRGPGGIREIEFLGQAFQLLRGGREPRLRVRPILSVLQTLAGLGLMPRETARMLQQAYVLLRHVENRLQVADDRQTHTLPTDETARARLAWSMGHAGWDDFINDMARVRARVEEAFEQCFAVPQDEARPQQSEAAQLAALWRGELDDAGARAALRQAGFADPRQALALLNGLREGRSYQVASTQGRKLLDRLMPLLLAAVGRAEAPETALVRIINLIERILGRPTYLALLLENPMALSQLVRLCAISAWIAESLTEHPILLDELLDPRTLYAPPGPAQLRAELQRQLQAIDEDDLEAKMDVLRQFRQVNALRVAAADISGALPVLDVGRHLGEIADVVLDAVWRMAWRDLARRHGPPPGLDQERPGFAIVAYGKLGGRELGYGSDLDLVFLHRDNDDGAHTTGPSSIDETVFFMRLGQRIIHVLNTPTTAGVLYEVDMRLRPSGASGLLVSGIGAYARYQREEAWTWEHQALVRARFVAGDADLGRGFAHVREQTLGVMRDDARLRADVREMRERMRGELDTSRRGWFDLKQGAGGLVDIEFIVQYLVLREAARHPAMLAHTATAELLRWFGANGILDEETADGLLTAWQALLGRSQRLTLQGQGRRVPDSELRQHRRHVCAVWARLLGG